MASVKRERRGRPRNVVDIPTIGQGDGPDTGLLERIQRRLDALGITETDADRAAGIPIGTIRNLRRSVTIGRGRGGMRSTTLSKLAPALHTTVEWLMNGEGVESTDNLSDGYQIPIAGLPILGSIKAGAWFDITIFQEEPKGMVPVARDQRFPHARQYALEVLGDSMDLEYPEHSFVVCVDFAESGLSLREHMTVHVERRNGDLVEITLKKIERRDGVVCLAPRSSNPVYKPYPLPTYVEGAQEPAHLAGTEITVRGVVIGRYEKIDV